MNIAEISKRLTACKAAGVTWSRIGSETGIHYTTIVRIVEGKHKDPSHSTIAKLAEWLDRSENGKPPKRRTGKATA